MPYCIDEENNFPFLVVLMMFMFMPVCKHKYNTSQIDDDFETFDEFINDLLAIRVTSGSVLFDMYRYACPTHIILCPGRSNRR